MLFLYRPRQTWMPYNRPRPAMDQDAYNLRLQQGFAATRQVPLPAPAATPPAAPPGPDPVDRLKDLAALHDAGSLTDAEFSAAKAKLLGLEGDAP